ncbi:DUF2642 domain-containing protein [Bacillus sp. BRMEA1]|uniref:DUF2642 domain-containing protein n=1 Tax=Neobacillus endophyticus TaxID=2738405 RepID=UPI0015658780|nr:DUF2642 domain-containing protein [Neobacillus endophyticus]NRD77901.1 DUF2642 domain-containing protein [Neobacillus endophyticus]
MSPFVDLIGKNIEIELSGGNIYRGILIDSGLDILVLYAGKIRSFLYLPLIHIQKLREVQFEEDEFYEPPVEKPLENDSHAISFRNILTNAKGRFLEVYVTGNQTIHGYLTSIMNDYFVFYSPIYKTLFISMEHVKWLAPYPEDATPYSLSTEKLSAHPISIPLARSFTEQCQKITGQLIVIDGGDKSEKIGLLQKVQNNMIVLITAEREPIHRNITHIKTIHLP